MLAGGGATLPFRADRLVPLVAAVAGAAVLLLLAGLAGRWSGLLPWALALGGAAYAAFLVIDQSAIDAYAPIYGAGLLVVAELSYWSIERGVGGEGEGLGSRRVALIAAAVLVAGGIGGLILTMAELSVSGGLGLELLGVAAAIAALAVIGVLARRQA